MHQGKETLIYHVVRSESRMAVEHYKRSDSQEKSECLVKIEQRYFTVSLNVKKFRSSNGEYY